MVVHSVKIGVHFYSEAKENTPMNGEVDAA
jgi:hypothetical protein